MVWWLRYKLGVGIWIELEALKTKLVRHRVQPGQVEHALAEAFRARDNSPYFDVDMDGLTTWVRARGRYVDDNNDDSNDDDWRDYGDDGPGPIPSARAMGPIPIGARARTRSRTPIGARPRTIPSARATVEDEAEDDHKREGDSDDDCWGTWGPKAKAEDEDEAEDDPKPKDDGGDSAGQKPEDLEDDGDEGSTEPGTVLPPCRVCGVEGCNNSCLLPKATCPSPRDQSAPSDSSDAKVSTGPKPAGLYIRGNFSACPASPTGKACPKRQARPPPPPPPRPRQPWISESDIEFGDMMATRLASQPPPPKRQCVSQSDLEIGHWMAAQRDIEDRFLIDAVAVMRRDFELQRQHWPR